MYVSLFVRIFFTPKLFLDTLLTDFRRGTQLTGRNRYAERTTEKVERRASKELAARTATGHLRSTGRSIRVCKRGKNGIKKSYLINLKGFEYFTRLETMNFSPESQQGYFDQMRSLIQQRSQAMITGHNGPLGASYNPTEALTKFIHNGHFNGGQMTSVIQPPMSHLYRKTEKLSRYSDDIDDRRHSTLDSVGSSGSNISPAMSSADHDDLAESPAAKVPSQMAQPLSPVAEEPDHDGVPPGTPKSEISNDYHDSDSEFDTRNRSGNYNDLLHQQLLHRKGSILQYCLSNPSGRIGLPGGSDADADHTSTSPGSSDMQDDVAPGRPFVCQICDYTSESKFHFNSHMNTHTEHRCPVPDCNYATRTEGRLRRHVKNHHNPNGGSSDEPTGSDSLDDLRDASGISEGLVASQESTTTSSGKQKNYKCKQCHDFIATSKNEYYDHQRLHIKPEKLLVCPMAGCRFVTEYKHHLEYHVRNHSGSKPFKCPNANCNYQCVNKSMLNSHMKSHSNFYQFRCECGYATKYCHSLKQHLKRNQTQSYLEVLRPQFD